MSWRDRPARRLFAAAFLSVSAPAAPPATANSTSGQESGIILSGTLEQGALVRGIAPPGTARLSLDGQPVAFDATGHFVLGFDRDQAERAVLRARLHDGTSVVRTLRIAPRSWSIERVNAPRRPDGATAAYMRRRKIELARITAARARNSPARGWIQAFIWPVRARISGRFGAQRIYRGEPAAFHSGVDIAPGAGAPVVAPADGIVVLAGPPVFSLEGNLVIIDHGMGLNSAFLHLASVTVREGQNVRQGQAIGTVGATGRATGPHLHWSVKWYGARLDPERLVGPGG